MKWAKIPFVDIFLEASDKRGKIRFGDTQKEVKHYTRGNRYQHFSALVNGAKKTVYVHRCVLSAHKPIEGYESLQVHHKDHNPENNNLSNLVWCTPSENLLYSLNDGRLEYSKLKASENARNQLRKGTHAFFNLTEEQHRLKYINRSKNYKEKGNHPNKGRTGLKGTNCKLTIELINQIKERHKNGEYAVRIARLLNLNRQTIDNVIHNKKNYT